jgi:Protein of unknown function (DUF2934)
MSTPAAKRLRKTKPAQPPRAAAVAPPPVLKDESSEAPDVPRLESEEVARLAYSYWEARGGQGGSPEEDWLRAKQEIQTRSSPAEPDGLHE